MNPALPVVSDQTFAETATVVLDGRRYERCNFAGCTIIYHGRYAEVFDCIFAPRVLWNLQGAALETVLALQSCGFDFVHTFRGKQEKIRLKRESDSQI
jgi:hypothetical protein